MSVTVYKVGFQHGAEGKKYMEHRDGQPYDTENDNRSYFNGYHAGSLKPQRLIRKAAMKAAKKRIKK